MPLVVDPMVVKDHERWTFHFIGCWVKKSERINIDLYDDIGKNYGPSGESTCHLTIYLIL